MGLLIATIFLCSHVNSNPIKNGTDVDPQLEDPNENTVVLEEKSKANPDGGANTNIETKKQQKKKSNRQKLGRMMRIQQNLQRQQLRRQLLGKHQHQNLLKQDLNH